MIENLSGLERFQQEKRKETIDKVTKAIETLEAEGKEVNFKSVSNVSFITRKTLYKVPEIRAMIEGLRKTPEHQSSFYQDSLKRRVAELEKENMELKDKVKMLSGIKYSVVKLKEYVAANLASKSA